MPTRNVVLTEYQSLFKKQAARFEALRQAIQTGIDDMDADNFSEFRTTDELLRHFTSLSVEALAAS